jgi:hypothetical protein
MRYDVEIKVGREWRGVARDVAQTIEQARDVAASLAVVYGQATRVAAR